MSMNEENQVLNYRIIYPNNDGGVSILIPSKECLSIERLIQDVPDGKPYQVVPASDIPEDRTYRDAWIYEEE